MISISTPAGSSRAIRASTVLGVDLVMSMRRLWVRRSNCSRLSLYLWTARRMVTTSFLVGSSCTGTPVDCVKLAINEVLERKPDLLVSGINHGGNMAICVNYSGTMGAAAEGCIFNVPSMGVSLLDHAADADFSECCRLGRMLARRVLKEGLPHGTYLNLNVPKLPQVKGLKVCRQADGRWVREFKRSENASGEPVFWLTGAFESAKPIHPDNDMLALDSGYASLVPCKIDVTDYNFMATLNNWIL